MTQFCQLHVQSIGRAAFRALIALVLAGPLAAASPAAISAPGQSGMFTIGNGNITWRGELIGETLKRTTISDHISRGRLALAVPYFRITLGNGKVITSADFHFAGRPEIEPLKTNDASAKLADHFPGREFVADMTDHAAHLEARFSVRVRQKACYLRERVVLHSLDGKILIHRL
ncbi:MAG: hypothetical protein M0Z50_04170, partial [Planctomycetia bacterium]|nr:hypothetical protein [Planctomycetia bacterium]